jgi:hypothetical protein
LDKTPQRRYRTANELAQAYITALTFPDQIEEDILPSLLYNTEPLDTRAVESVMQGEQGKKLVLPNAQYPAPAAISSRRRERSNRAAPVVTRPTTSRVQPRVQKIQSPTRSRRARYRRSNRVLISMTVVLMMLVLVLVLALILAFIFK